MSSDDESSPDTTEEKSESSEECIVKHHKKHKKVKWGDSETLYLFVGKLMYGESNWKTIFKELRPNFNKDRKKNHLRDRLRTLRDNVKFKDDFAWYERNAQRKYERVKSTRDY
jgi:hypothetical protein